MTAPLSIGVACFSTFGGSGVVAAEVATSLARRGHRVHVFSDAPPGRLDRTVVAFHAVEAPAYPQLGHDLYTLALASKIIDVARRDGLDIVHAHYALPHAVSAELARQVLVAEGPASAPRVVTTLHGTDTTLVGIDPTFLPLTRFSVLGSDAVTVPSVWLAETTRRNLALPAAFPLDVIPNFVDTDRFAPKVVAGAAAPPVILHVSNFRPLKRVTDVVRVFARVRAARPARLCLVGDGPDREAALTLARELGVAADVAFLGERDDLPGLVADAAVFLLPSETESFGLAALEALACGVPVVASRVGGVPEVVLDGEVGFLHAVGDCDAMAASIVRLLDDPTLRARLGRAARARALGTFRVEPAVLGYEEIYRRVLAAPRRAT